MSLNREQILGAEDLPRELVPVPEWGGELWVRTMTAAERDDFEIGSLKNLNGTVEIDRRNLRASLVARCAISEDGGRLFTDADIVTLGGKSAAAMDRVYAVAARLNRLSAADAEELAKN